MSGSDASFGDSAADVSCESLIIETYLGSPKPAVVATLKAQQVLAVELRHFQGIYVVVALSGDDIAGGLASPRAARLRDCLIRGFKYKATVLEIADGEVKVRITPLVGGVAP